MGKKRSFIAASPAVVAFVWFVIKSAGNTILGWIGLQVFVRFWNWIKEKYGKRSNKDVSGESTSEQA